MPPRPAPTSAAGIHLARGANVAGFAAFAAQQKRKADIAFFGSGPPLPSKLPPPPSVDPGTVEGRRNLRNLQQERRMKESGRYSVPLPTRVPESQGPATRSMRPVEPVVPVLPFEPLLSPAEFQAALMQRLLSLERDVAAMHTSGARQATFDAMPLGFTMEELLQMASQPCSRQRRRASTRHRLPP
jgi:hypothetical protein